MSVTQISKRRPPRTKSQFDLYPLPFFNADAACRTWNVTATGDYTADCDTGRRYAIEFLKTCDGTVGWASLLGQITADMIRAGASGAFPDGHPKVNGIVIGFMSVISRAVIAGSGGLLAVLDDLAYRQAVDHQVLDVAFAKRRTEREPGRQVIFTLRE